MDFNMMVLSGRMVGHVDMATYDSGAKRARFLVTVRQETPRRRLDVLPVIYWIEPDDPRQQAIADRLASIEPGTRIYVSGSIERRFIDSGNPITLVARDIHIQAPKPAEGQEQSEEREEWERVR